MITALEVGRLIPATGHDVIENAVVVIDDDGKVAAVGRRRDVEVPAGAERIEAHGKTALPGLIDMHAHMLSGTDEEAREGETVRTITDQTLRGVNNARSCIMGGVTSIRDAGSRHEGIFRFKKAIDEGWAVGPRVIPAGRAICMTGGHGHNSIGTEADGSDAVRRLARQQLKFGARQIKLLVTGGAGAPGARIQDLQLTVDEMRAAVEETHKKGYHTLAHVSTSEGAMAALEAGVDCIEHGLILDEATVQEMARRGTYYDPTVEVYERIARLGTAQGYQDYMVEKAATLLDAHRESVRLAMTAGVKIIAGTDAGGHSWQLGDLADELGQLVACGMAPLDAILAATRTAAECLQMDDTLGTLQPGRWGDVLVVEGDPIDDITALKSIWGVFKGGHRLR